MIRHTRFQGVIVRDYQVLLIKHRELNSGRGWGLPLFLFATLLFIAVFRCCQILQTRNDLLRSCQ